ncbi:unnamed protein product [Enterobius vermicularis]|uniref:Thymidine diphospho-4-keto-rhamnose 3,5-epimerase n=1 Tax=Enterobius vermicularis TaxID=51028 RepID=A0A0N4VPP5_ENTVE|nr:unnamed protein product [Enterobius vermicularis]
MGQPELAKRVKPEIISIPGFDDLKLIRPKAFPDSRGFFIESYNISDWESKLGFCEIFKQDNHSFSKFGVLRGLHIQPGMGKLVTVISGKIFDVAVDARPDSKTYGKWHAEVLDSTRPHFWIPDGFLHGFYTMSPEGAHVVYKCTDVYNPDTEFGVDPFDRDIAVSWPISKKEDLIISDRDRSHGSFRSILEKFDVIL